MRACGVSQQGIAASGAAARLTNVQLARGCSLQPTMRKMWQSLACNSKLSCGPAPAAGPALLSNQTFSWPPPKVGVEQHDVGSGAHANGSACRRLRRGGHTGCGGFRRQRDYGSLYALRHSEVVSAEPHAQGSQRGRALTGRTANPLLHNPASPPGRRAGCVQTGSLPCRVPLHHAPHMQGSRGPTPLCCCSPNVL